MGVVEMNPRVRATGTSGCGQNGECFEMMKDQNIFGTSKEGQLEAIREIALMHKMTRDEAKKQWYSIPKVKQNPDKLRPYWAYFYEHRSPVVVHHLNEPEVHALARKLLV